MKAKNRKNHLLCQQTAFSKDCFAPFPQYIPKSTFHQVPLVLFFPVSSSFAPSAPINSLTKHTHTQKYTQTNLPLLRFCCPSSQEATNFSGAFDLFDKQGRSPLTVPIQLTSSEWAQSGKFSASNTEWLANSKPTRKLPATAWRFCPKCALLIMGAVSLGVSRTTIWAIDSGLLMMMIIIVSYDAKILAKRKTRSGFPSSPMLTRFFCDCTAW